MTPATPVPVGSVSGAGKRVSAVELFFDLVFVFAIARIVGVLHEDHTPTGLLRVLVVFVPVYWAWVGTSMHADLHDIATAKDRLRVLALALCSFVIALAIPQAFGPHAVLLASMYWVLRILLFATSFHARRGLDNPFTVAAVVSGPMLLGGALLGGPAQPALWAAAAIADLATPWWLRHRLRRAAFDPDHVSERFGLFFLVCLGEILVDLGKAVDSHHLGPQVLAGVVTGFVVAASLWWLYFDRAAEALRDRIAAAVDGHHLVRRTLPYAHLGLLLGIVSAAAGLTEAVEHPGTPLRAGDAALLCVGLSLHLATYGYLRFVVVRRHATARLLAAAAALGVLVLAIVVAPPAVVTLTVLAGLLAGTVVAERCFRRRPAGRGSEPPASGASEPSRSARR